jgi:hypothetical protein
MLVCHIRRSLLWYDVLADVLKGVRRARFWFCEVQGLVHVAKTITCVYLNHVWLATRLLPTSMYIAADHGGEYNPLVEKSYHQLSVVDKVCLFILLVRDTTIFVLTMIFVFFLWLFHPGKFGPPQFVTIQCCDSRCPPQTDMCLRLFKRFNWKCVKNCCYSLALWNLLSCACLLFSC